MIDFSIFSINATNARLLLFHRGEAEAFADIPFPEKFRIGGVYSMLVFGLDIEDVEYGYIMDGPYDPKRGMLFDAEEFQCYCREMSLPIPSLVIIMPIVNGS